MKKSKIYSAVLLVCVPFLLISCFAAKEYEKTEIVSENNYRTDNIQLDSTTIAAISWRELFTDATLQDYVDVALVNNIDIRVAAQRIYASEAFLKQGKAAYFPSLTGVAQYTRQEFSQNSQFGSQFSSLDQYQLAGRLSWEADIWGKIRSNERAFNAAYLQSIAAHKAVKTELIANLVSTYYQLLALDEQKSITERTIATRQEALETIQALKEAGNVTAVGVKQTEAQLYAAQAILIDIETQARLLENSFSILLGKQPDAVNRSQLSLQQITTPLKTGVPAQLLSNRPDVIAAEFDLVNAFELTNVARSKFYPSLTIDATAGLQSLDFSKLFDPNSFFANIMAGLTQPIFNRRQIRTEFEVSKAEQEQARLNFRQAFLTATKEVSDALYQYDAASRKVIIKEKEYNAYETATEYSELLLDNGLINYLELLNARENSLRSSLDVIDEKNNQLQAIVELYRALGGGWQ